MPVVLENTEEKCEIGEGRTRYLAKTDNLMTAVIDFNDGPHQKADEPHQHPHEQLTYIASGELDVFIGEEKNRLKAGDMFMVPSNVPHTVQVLSKHARLIDSFTPIREDFLK